VSVFTLSVFTDKGLKIMPDLELLISIVSRLMESILFFSPMVSLFRFALSVRTIDLEEGIISRRVVSGTTGFAVSMVLSAMVPPLGLVWIEGSSLSNQVSSFPERYNTKVVMKSRKLLRVRAFIQVAFFMTGQGWFAIKVQIARESWDDVVRGNCERNGKRGIFGLRSFC
jgi:hypothetical protein